MGSSPAPEIKVKITGEDTGVSAAIKELSLQLQQLKRTQDDAGGSARRLGEAEAGAGRSMRENRESARLLSEETGVRLNKALTGVIARSATLGPLLEVAFPIAAAIGFGEVIASGTEKLTALIANTFIYTEAMQKEYSAQVAANKEFEKSAEKIKELKKAYDLIGLSGSDLGRAKLEQLRKEIDEADKALDRIKKKPAAVEEAPLWKQVLGKGLRTMMLDTGIEKPQTEPGIQAKDREVGLAQERKGVLTQEQLNQQKEDEAEAKKEREATQKAKLAQIEAGFANELSLYKAQHSKVDQDNEASYVKGLESLAAYYDRKKQLAAEASKKEIETLTAERKRVLAAPTKAGPQGDPERIANQTKAAALANQIAIARVNAAKTQAQLTNEQSKKQDELDKKVLEFQSQIARAQGLRFDEAAARIAAEATEMSDKLREAGIAPDQIDAMVAKFKAAATQQAHFADMKTGGQGAISALTDDEEDIRLKNLAVVADVKIAELERQRIPVLQKLAAEMKAAAVGAEQIKEADDFARGVDRIAEAAKKSAVSMTAFKDQASQAIKGELTNFLGSTITQAKSVGDAFRQLGQSVVGSIQRIVAAMLVEIVTAKLVKALTHQDAGATGIANAAAKGAAEAGPLIIASTTMTAAGATITASGVALGISAAALQVAADTLIIANSMGGGVGLAGGGLVTGPGTSTSDSISARLSSGEFVVRAAAVRAVGLDHLATINRGFRIPSIRGMSIPRFAEGGLVSHGVGSDGVLNIGLGLDPGLILKHLSSKAGQKIVLSHIGNNPKAVSKAISRGQS